MICNSGVGLTPTLDGALYHFSAGGLYDGLILLIDDETKTYWDHITGEAVHGPLVGARLETWPLEITTVETASKRYPDLRVALSSPSLWARFASGMQVRMTSRDQGFLPPGFRGTMGETDPRRPEMDKGLGVVVDDRARYFPMEALSSRAPLEHDWDGRALRVEVDEDRIPFAVWADDGDRPVQLFTRWYGFSFTYPGCDIVE